MRQTVREPSPRGPMRALFRRVPSARRKLANVRVTAGLNKVTFFAAAKKVTPAPGRGSANRPTRIQDFIEEEEQQQQQANKTNPTPRTSMLTARPPSSPH